MNRRDLLKTFLATGAAAGAPSLAAGCATVPIRPDGSPEPVPVDKFLEQGARVMWCAAHPDDECIGGALLARSSIFYGNPLYFLILTHGEGGECGLKRGCKPDLRTVRGQEMREAAERYRAVLQHEHFFNAPLPVSSFPKRHQIYAIWKKQKDPVAVVAEAMRSFRPDLVLTFDPDWGATGHPEHQLASRVATAAVRLCADSGAELGSLAPHRVSRVYQVINRHWLFRLAFQADPGPVTESWDATSQCSYGESCLEFMLKATRVHRTQHRDMGTVRDHPWLFSMMHLRQVDAFSEIKDPTAAE